MNKISLKEVVLVEGKYDKIKLQTFIDTPIIETNGFRIFKDNEKKNLIRTLAKSPGILIMTDSDHAGQMIRNHIKGIVKEGNIYNCYVPQILGKEKRKEKGSKEGYLGVEGIDIDILIKSINKSGATIIGKEKEKREKEITKEVFFDLGLIGQKDSSEKRKRILSSLSFPTYLSTKAMIDAVNCIFTKEEFIKYIKNK